MENTPCLATANDKDIIAVAARRIATILEKDEASIKQERDEAFSKLQGMGIAFSQEIVGDGYRSFFSLTIREGLSGADVTRSKFCGYLIEARSKLPLNAAMTY
jgi:hypothetical protein